MSNVPATTPHGRRRFLADWWSSQCWPGPERRVRLIVPAAPGSSLDLETRLLADGMAARWGRPVVVESHLGADGIGAARGVITVTPILHPQLGFDPLAELAPLVDLRTGWGGAARPAVPVDLVLAATSAVQRRNSWRRSARDSPPANLGGTQAGSGSAAGELPR